MFGRGLRKGLAMQQGGLKRPPSTQVTLSFIQAILSFIQAILSFIHVILSFIHVILSVAKNLGPVGYRKSENLF
jgi:hypothetical protein